MDRRQLRVFLHTNTGLTSDIILDRIYSFFNNDNVDEVTMEEWLAGFAVLLKGSEGDLLRFCFYVYDLNGDGYISRWRWMTMSDREEMLILMKGSLHLAQDRNCIEGMEEQEEGLRVGALLNSLSQDLVEMTLRKMDSRLILEKYFFFSFKNLI